MNDAIKSDAMQEGIVSSTLLQKQFITDEEGHRIGVILPIDDYSFVEPLLRQRAKRSSRAREHRHERLQRAVDVMQEEYSKNDELTAFTSLDGEDFVE